MAHLSPRGIEIPLVSSYITEPRWLRQKSWKSVLNQQPLFGRNIQNSNVCSNQINLIGLWHSRNGTIKKFSPVTRHELEYEIAYFKIWYSSFNWTLFHRVPHRVLWSRSVTQQQQWWPQKRSEIFEECNKWRPLATWGSSIRSYSTSLAHMALPQHR